MLMARAAAVALVLSGALAGQTVRGITGPGGGQRNVQALAGRPRSVETKPGAPRQLPVFAGDNVLAQFVDGGLWSTEVTTVNLEDVSWNFQVYFLADDGKDLSVPIAGVGPVIGLDITLNPGGTFTFRTEGTAATLTQGWAIMDRGQASIGGMGVFRLSVPGRPDFEAVVPFASQVERIGVLVFNNRSGFSTGVAVANSAPWAVQSQVTILDDKGALIERKVIDLEAFTHFAKSLPDWFPSTAGISGTITFATADEADAVSVLGLRFNPTGPFTSVHTLSNILW